MTSLTFKAEVEASLFRNVPHNLGKYKGKLKCPALLVTAKDGAVCRPAMYERLIQHNNIDHTEFKGGHMFPLEHPEAVAELISTTISKWNN
jgi:pimeloyl-ACP methyl ester carboxylesterase